MKKKITSILLCVLALFAALTLLTGCQKKEGGEEIGKEIGKEPTLAEKVAAAYEKTAQANEKEQNPTKKLGIALSLDLSPILKELELDLPLGINADIFTDEETKAFSLDGNLLLSGKPAVDIGLRSDGKALVLLSEVLLKNKALGIDLEKAPEQIASSPLAAMLAEEGETVSLPSAENLNAVDFSALETKLPAFARDLMKELTKQLDENAEGRSEKTTVNLNGQEVEAESITFSFTKEGAARAEIALLTMLSEQEELLSALESLGSMIPETGSVENPIGNIREEIAKAIEEKKAYPESDAADKNEIATVLTFHINASEELFGLYVEVNDGGDSFFSLFFGPDPKDPVYIRADFKSKSSSEAEGHTEETNRAAVEMIRDPETGAFTFTMNLHPSFGESVLKGKLGSDENTIFEIESIEIGDTKIVFDAFRIYRDDTKTVEPLPEYTDLLAMTEDELQALLTELLGGVIGLALMNPELASLLS